jgi:hypothetical protein
MLVPAAVAAFLLSACADTGVFPAVHDMPAPRAEAPLTPDQVKAATDSLISERDHLSTETQANGPPNPPANAADAANAGSQTNAVAARPNVVPVAVTGSTQTAGADPKP